MSPAGLSREARRAAVAEAVRHGRDDLADALVDTWCDDISLDDEERDALDALVRHGARASRAFFFPLADLVAPTRCRVVEVRVEAANGDALPTAIGVEASAAVATALDAAWRFLDGEGVRPALRASLPLFDAVPGEARRIDGRSLHLAVFLAAVGALSGSRPARNVVVSGCPGEALRAVAAKARSVGSVAAALGLGELLALSGDRSAGVEAVDGVRVRWCDDVGALVALAYRVPPSLPTSRRRCVHVYSEAERVDVPARFRGRDAACVALPRLTAENFAAALDEALAALPRYEPVELSIGGPAVLGAALGWRLANQPTRDVWMVHAPDTTPWWHSRARLDATVRAAPPPGDGARVVITRYPHRAKPGWRVVPVAEHLTAHDVHDEVARVTAALAPLGALDLALDVPVAFAWAAAAALRNQHARIGLWHYSGDAYALWHTATK